MDSIVPNGTEEQDAVVILNQLWEQHSRAYCTDKPGFGFIAQNWYCETCRTRYPCETAQLVGRWGQTWPADEAEYRPMRSAVVGEVVSEDGRSMRIDDPANDRHYGGAL